MDYKLLYHTALGWYSKTPTTYIVYEPTTTNVVRLLMKAHTITLVRGVSFVTVLVLSEAVRAVTNTVITISYGTHTTTTRLIDAIYIVNKLLHNNYVLQQQQPALTNIPADIQREIFKSGLVKTAQRLNTTTKAATKPLLAELCKVDVSPNEIIRYILEDEPEDIVFGIIDIDDAKDRRVTMRHFHLLSSGKEKHTKNRIDRNIILDYRKHYGVDYLPTYKRYITILSYDISSKLVYDGTTTKLHSTTAQENTNIIAYILKYMDPDDTSHLDLLSLKNIYNRRLSCVAQDPLYATKQVQAILQLEKAKLVETLESYVLYAMMLLTLLFYNVAETIHMFREVVQKETDIEPVKKLIAEYETILHKELI